MNIVDSLIALIAVGFCFGLAFWLMAFVQVRTEMLSARSLIKQNESTLATGTLAAALNATPKTLAERLVKDMVGQSGLAFARLSDVLDPLLDRVQRLNTRARAIPNLLLLLGLIATVAGLIHTLSGLGPDIQSAISAGDPKAVADQLGVTITAMGGAFQGTLYGVLATLILQLLNTFTSHYVGLLTGDLDRLGILLAPQIYPASTEKQLQSLQALLSKSEEFLAVTQREMAKTSTEFAAVLGTAGKAIETNLKTLDATSTRITGALLEASGRVGTSSIELTKAVTAIQEHRTDFRNIYSQFNEMFTHSMEALKLHSDGELKEIRQLQADFGTTGSAIVTEILNTSEKLGTLSDTLGANQHAYLTGVQKVEAALYDGFTRLDTQVGATLRSYTDEVGLVSTKLEGLSEHLGRSREATAQLAKTLQDKGDVDRIRIKDQAQRDHAVTTQLAALTAALGTLEGVITAYQQQPEQLARQAAEHTTLITQVLASGQQVYDRVSGVLQDVTGTLGAQHTLASQMHDQLREMGLLLSGLLDQAGALSDRLTSDAQQGAQYTLGVRDAIERLPDQLQVGELLRGSRDLQDTMARVLGTLERRPEPPVQGTPA